MGDFGEHRNLSVVILENWGINHMRLIWSLVSVGLFAGTLSGLFGIGGGVVIVPSLLYLLKCSPQTASGTSLVALLLPVGLLGAYQYYREGLIGRDHVHYGLYIAVGLLGGGWIGATLAGMLPISVLQRLFASFMVLVAIRLWWTA